MSSGRWVSGWRGPTVWALDLVRRRRGRAARVVGARLRSPAVAG